MTLSYKEAEAIVTVWGGVTRLNDKIDLAKTTGQHNVYNFPAVGKSGLFAETIMDVRIAEDVLRRFGRGEHPNHDATLLEAEIVLGETFWLIHDLDMESVTDDRITSPNFFDNLTGKHLRVNSRLLKDKSDRIATTTRKLVECRDKLSGGNQSDDVLSMNKELESATLYLNSLKHRLTDLLEPPPFSRTLIIFVWASLIGTVALVLMYILGVPR